MPANARPVSRPVFKGTSTICRRCYVRGPLLADGYCRSCDNWNDNRMFRACYGCEHDDCDYREDDAQDAAYREREDRRIVAEIMVRWRATRHHPIVRAIVASPIFWVAVLILAMGLIGGIQ